MPYRELIRFSYYTQFGHCLLGAFHLWIGLGTSNRAVAFLNGLFAGLNGLAFIYQANWRADMRKNQARNRDIFRR